MMTAILWMLIGAWGFCNLMVIMTNNGEQMFDRLIENQKSIIVRICANLFYLPAWIMKLLWCFLRKILDGISIF